MDFVKHFKPDKYPSKPHQIEDGRLAKTLHPKKAIKNPPELSGGTHWRSAILPSEE
jgi:hypothetical protein